MRLSLRLHVAWWLRWYLVGVVLMCWMTRMQPNEERFRYWIRKAIKLRIEYAATPE